MKTALSVILLILATLLRSHGHQCCNDCNYDDCCSSCHTNCYTPRCISICQNKCCRTPVACPTLAPQKSTTPTTSPTITTTPKNNSSTGPPPPDREGGANKMTVNVNSSNIINNLNNITLGIKVHNKIYNNISSDGCCDGGVRVVEVPIKVCNESCPNGGTSTMQPPTRPPPTLPPPPPPPPPGCCVIIIPCVSQNCYPYRYKCHDCAGKYGYLPINPCEDGCYRRSSWTRQRCSLNQCVSREVDCSYCSDDFYSTYSGYSQCQGCFYQ